MKVRLDSSIYTSDEARHELLKKTADILSDYAFMLSNCGWLYGSTALEECEYHVASAATEYLNYYYAKENT